MWCGKMKTYIENGVVLRGYADKRIAARYGVEHTGSAWRTHSDIPNNGNVNLRIQRSDRTIRELLNQGGRGSDTPSAFFLFLSFFRNSLVFHIRKLQKRDIYYPQTTGEECRDRMI